MKIIELNNISKSFGRGSDAKSVLNGISLTISQGEFVVLRGMNGSGKTTLLNIILGLLKPDSGEAKLFGRLPEEAESKASVGVVLQKVTVPKHLKVKELVNLFSSYYSNSLSVDEILNTVNLEGKHDAWAYKLCGGEEQRLYFALALAGNPKLLILDEPTRNLDEEGCTSFWNQVKTCVQQDITILMVTNNQSDWQELNHLATRSITLKDGQISEDKDINKREELVKSAEINDNKIDFSPSKINTFKSMLLKQIWAESLQFVRNPGYLLGIILFSCLIVFFPPDQTLGKLGLIFFAGINLLTFAIERLGKIIASERIEGWLKLLRITPLPPAIYLSAKIIMALSILAVNLTIVLSLGAWKIGVEQSVGQWLIMFFSLILGIIPFAIFGLALGYLVKPKSIDSIAALSIPIALFSCGLPLPVPKFVQDLISFSPFYHYGQLAMWSAALDHDQHLWLHLLWLLWVGCIFSFVALWAYRRDQVLQ
jgi:ABC-2 type transport system ATP-binding protein